MYRVLLSSVVAMFVLLGLVACGDPTNTSLPSSVSTPPTGGNSVPAGATNTNTAVVKVVITPTTQPNTTLNPSSSPVEFVRKYDTTLMKAPAGMGVDSQDSLYAADAALDSIFKFNQQGKVVMRWGKHGNADGEFDFASGVPSGGLMAINKQDIIFVSDTYNNRIQKFDINGKFLGKWSVEASGDVHPKGPGPLAIDGQGNLYVSLADGISKYDESGNLLVKWNNIGQGDGQFLLPSVGAVDKQGKLYVADLIAGRIQVLDASNGNFVAKWGKKGAGDGEFKTPVELVLDSQNNVYVTDNSNRVQKFSSDGKFLGKWDNPGNGDAAFGITVGIAIDNRNNIYISELIYKSIYQFRLL